MKCKRTGNTLMIQCKKHEIVQFAWNPQEAWRELVRREGLLLKTGAKAYSHMNGWWRVSGYAPDLSDILPIEAEIRSQSEKDRHL